MQTKHLIRLVSCRRCSTHSRWAQSPVVTQSLNFLNGQRVEPTNTETFNLVIPATGEVLRTVRQSGASDVDNAVNCARTAQSTWAALTGFERGKILKRAADIIRKRQEELAHIETLDSGKPIWEARCDIQGCADSIEYYGGLAASISGNFLPVSGGSFAYTIREPLGVVGGIGAWNYPFQMASWKSGPALACGNTFVFKPSELTPLTAVMLGEVYKEAGLPDGCYNVVQGQAETGSLLSHHGDVDKMTFTGSVAVGSKVMEACAKGIKHVTLELGGKSPVLIFDDCNLDNAVKGAMMANFLTQGQVCSNGTRVFVQKKIFGEFLENLVNRTKAMKIGDPFAEDTTVGATISAKQADTVMRYVEIAKKEGAKVECGGERVTPAPVFAGGQFISPCVLSGCHDDMTVVKEEVFGPVLSLLEFDCEEEAVSRANNTTFGLSGGVFTKDLTRAHRVISQLQAGSLYVNNYNLNPTGVPFGGYKTSGIGRENGPESVEYYTQVKSVYVEMNDVDAPF